MSGKQVYTQIIRYQNGKLNPETAEWLCPLCYENIVVREIHHKIIDTATHSHEMVYHNGRCDICGEYI